MIIDHPDFGPRIEALVGDLERETRSEIVVVAARHSGSYRDVRLGVATGLALLALFFLLFSPLQFHPISIPLYLAALAGLGWWLAGRSPGLSRRLTRAARREAQVLEAAKASFVEVAVHGTRERTGLLVYISELEGRAVLLRDLGLDGLVPGAAWSGLRLEVHELDQLEVLLRQVGAILAEHVPAEGDNPDEIPNAPRVRS